MTEYKPDSWAVIKMTYKDETFYKILGGWSGGYLDGNSWRLSSIIEKCVHDNDKLHFYGSSGSVYSVNPGHYGLRMATVGIWDQMKERYPDQVELLEDCNWKEKSWND